MMNTRMTTTAVIVALSVLLGACERSEVDGVGSNTPSEDAPPQHDLVEPLGCVVGEWGWVSGEGEINNATNDVATYEVVVAFYDGSRRLADQNTWIRDVEPAESARFEAYAWLDDEADTMTSCEVITINRWSARIRD